ncbi:hypothetical protein [Aeromicrobium piscarium]|nr:hypothetical protein [Aeromicrobium piscarium]
MTPDQLTAAITTLVIILAVGALATVACYVERVEWVQRAMDWWMGGGE